MARVLLTPLAESDLEAIWLTVALDNPTAADRLLARIGEKLERLGDFPDMGAPRPELAPGARLLVEGSYLVLYETMNDGVLVVRVVHGARDLTDLI